MYFQRSTLKGKPNDTMHTSQNSNNLEKRKQFMGRVLSVVSLAPTPCLHPLFTLLYPQWFPAVPQTQGPVPALGTLNLVYSRTIMLSSDMPKACYSPPIFRHLFELVLLPRTQYLQPLPQTCTHHHHHHHHQFTLPDSLCLYPVRESGFSTHRKPAPNRMSRLLYSFMRQKLLYHYLF